MTKASQADPGTLDDQGLINTLVQALRGPDGVGYARELLELMREGEAMLDGMPAPMALMMAGHAGGWMDQYLLSGTGGPRQLSMEKTAALLAKRHMALMRWAARWSDKAVAQDMLALGWLVLVERIEHPRLGSLGDRRPGARQAWEEALEKMEAPAAKHGMDSPGKLMARARAQVGIVSLYSDSGICEKHRWGRNAPRVALLCARAFPPGFGDAGEQLWLGALSVIHLTGTGWNPVREAQSCRYLAKPVIAAVAGRLAHPRLDSPPGSPAPWVDVLGLSAATEALIQCWMVVAQPNNPVVEVPQESRPRLQQDLTQVVVRHMHAHPS